MFSTYPWVSKPDTLNVICDNLNSSFSVVFLLPHDSWIGFYHIVPILQNVYFGVQNTVLSAPY